jgi:hypothetical protein
MKVRQGFVSNSSSSSFLMYGVWVDSTEELEEYRYGDKEAPEGITIDAPEGDGTLCVGASWDSVGDNETGAQFKARVEEAVRAFLMKLDIKVDTFGTQKEAWRDG